jgi:hypothetical protein
MGSESSDRREDRLGIEVRVLGVLEDEQPPKLIAYAFSRGGRLLSRVEVDGGKAVIAVPASKEPASFRVLIGPPIDSKDDGEILSTLIRLDALEQMVSPSQRGEDLRFTIDRYIWTCWFRFCNVRGTLLKRLISGGLPVDLPVCGAEVEIYEVDPIRIILPKIPDWVLDRIRYLVRKPGPPPPPEKTFPYGVPFPPVPPGPDPTSLLGAVSFDTSFTADTTVAAGARAPANMSTIEYRNSAGAEKSANVRENADKDGVFNFISGESTTASSQEVTASLRALSETPEIVSAASVSLGAFKSSLLARAELLRPIFCWIWPQAVATHLVGTATTDSCGHFRTRIYTGCSSDTPDLYFKAYRRLGSFRIQIYGPLPISCHTWWDHACGTEITLYTTSPFALTCAPCKPVIAPSHWVLAMAVGNTSLVDIRGTSTLLSGTMNASNIGLTSDGSPFGGYVRLRFEFDNALRTDLNVKYYSVSWRKFGSGNSFVELTEDVWRHYAHVVGTDLMIEPYKIGPQPVGGTANLYEIPPELPPIGQWSTPDVVVDTTSAAFSSTVLAPAGGGEGNYEFQLTLFDAAGNAVNANLLGINFVVPTTSDLTSTINTANAASLGLVTADGKLLYQLHLDNNVCSAALLPPDITGSVSADPCGLLRYSPGDSITLHWSASHPHQFATFAHAVVEGAQPLPMPFSTSGVVTPAPGTHNETFAVDALRGTCEVAGFAETVSAYAMATDGWNRQSQYDRSKIQAFALAPAL